MTSATTPRMTIRIWLPTNRRPLRTSPYDLTFALAFVPSVDGHGVDETAFGSQASWPGLSRPSTPHRFDGGSEIASVTGKCLKISISELALRPFDWSNFVDGRDKPGHDDLSVRIVKSGRLLRVASSPTNALETGSSLASAAGTVAELDFDP